MATSEDIEARLCAYVEGDLDPAQKSEIERHLQSHPQHRQMILDLVRTRRLIADLPRHSAPVDLTDGLSGHLERTMLLSDFPAVNAAHDPWRIHARRAPKLLIKAAVFLLCASLVAVVGAMLHIASRPAQIADLTASPPIPQLSVIQPPAIVPPPPQPADDPLAATSPATQPDVAVAADPSTQPSPIEANQIPQPAAAQPVPTPAVTTQPSDSAEIASAAILASLSISSPTTLPTDFTIDISTTPASPATMPSEVTAAPATRPVDDAPEPQ